MGLREYFRKRSFSKTPEPKGVKKTAVQGHKLKFVVQEHHASRLHYDFRLEIDGVLKSWAVPKGPSMNPHDHHLAVQTEDHPYDYRNFEGVIPEGNYGAGNVIIWDEGWYEARKDDGKDSEKTLRKELKEGHITFVVHGKKLKGEFALIKMHDAKEENAWLLIKKGDEFATTADITKQDTSVRSHHKVDDLGAHNKLPPLNDYPKVAKPWAVKPMLCTLVDEPFSREGWLFEIKWDGYRAIGSKHEDSIELYSRNGLDFSGRYVPVTEALRELGHDVIVDGEIVVVDSEGSAHFEWLQGWKKEPQGTLQYYIFDILWCDGRDVRGMPLTERKALLKAVLPTKSDILKFSDDVPEKGLALFKEMQRRGMEGMVAKRADSTYRENDRGQDWLKIKTHLRQEVVIGGFTEPRGGRKYLGSLLVGIYDKKGNYIYVGHSGGGIPDDQRKELHQKLLRLERKTSPFNIEPKPNAPVHWVRPEVVCEMSFSEWTHDGYMRHPQFEGLRPDKEPSQVRREQPKTRKKPDGPVVATTSTAAGEDVVDGTGTSGSHRLPFEATHLDKVFFPKHKYTKGDLFKYYEMVADYILPYLRDRPLSMNRMPDGIKGPSFFQKNNEHLPDWVPSADIFSDSNNANLHWIVGGELNTLLYIVQLGSIEINPWNSRVKHLDKPDWIVIDLDPEGIGFERVIEVARTVKEVCDEWGIPSHPKTSGKTGLHIYIPMGAKYTYEQAKNLAHLIVLEVNKRQPKITSVERMPEKRKHKIYLDFLQNREGQTLAAPYSVRPTPEASVSMPLHWDEVKSGLKPSDFTIQNTPARLKRTGDLWKPVVGKGIDLAKILKNIEKHS
jgi:bifunctional non-homologous end joining protein LigD